MTRCWSLLVVLALALGCASNVSLGSQRDAAPNEDAPDTTVPGDVAGPDAPEAALDAPEAVLDAPDEAAPDVAAPDAAAPDAVDAPDAPIVTSPLCTASVWGTLGPADTEHVARGFIVDVPVPPARCAQRPNAPYVLYRLRLDRRTGVELSMQYALSVSVRRSCVDPSSELACARVTESIPGRFVLDAGTYDVLFEQDAFRFFEAQVVRLTTFTAPPPGLDGDRCEGAIEVAPDATLPTETLGHASTPRGGCLPGATGPAAYYKTRVPAGARLVVTVLPNALDGTSRGGASGFAATVRLLASCGASACLAAAASPAVGAAGVGWTNPAATPAEVTIVVAAAGEPPTGRFALSLRTVRPMTNTACDGATELTDGAVLRGQDLTAATAPPTRCAIDGGATGPVLFYRARVPAHHQLVVRTSPNSVERAEVPTVLRFHLGCGGAACVNDRFTRAFAFTGQLASWENTDDVAQDVVVTLGALTAAGSPSVDLQSWIRPRDPNQRCEQAIAVPAEGLVDGFTTNGATDTQAQCTWALSSSGALLSIRYYRVTVPARSETLLSMDRWLASSGLQIRTIDACATRRCGPEVPDEPVRLVNAGTAPREFLFLVGSLGPGGERYGLRTRTLALGTEPTCAAARELAVPSRIMESTLPPPVNVPASCQNPQGARVRYYRATAPPRSILSLYTDVRTLSRTAVTRSCGGACTNPDQDFATWPAPRYLNNSDAPAEVYFTVQAWEPAVAPYSVWTRAAPIAPNGTCATAQTVTLGTTLRNLDPAGGQDSSPHYRTPIGRQGLFYRVHLEPGETMAVQAAQRDGVDGSWALAMALVPSCDFVNPVALSFVSRLAPTAGLYYAHREAAARDFILVAEAYGALAGTFDLAFLRAASAAPGDCAAPVELRDGETLRDVPLLTEFGVGPTTPAGSQHLRAVLPAGYELSLTSTAPLNLRAARACDASALTQVNGVRRFAWSNPGGGDGEVRIAAQPGDLAATRTDLAVTIRPQPYLRSSVAGSCDALPDDAPEVLAPGETVSAVRALPFAWRYFGEAMAGWSVAGSGFLQVWPTLAGTPRGDLSPDAVGVYALPATEAPPRAIAPYWSGFERAPTSRVRAATVATPRPHLTVQWSDLRACCSGVLPQRATFQAKLFADDGSVEFHYCAGTTAVLTRQAAAIGLQDATGTSGSRVTSRVPRGTDMDLEAVNPTTGWRFTPRP